MISQSKSKVGMVFGVFDGLHPGHKFFLSSAARKSEQLIVVVTLPEVVAFFKGKMPVHDFDERVSNIKAFDASFMVIPGDKKVGSWEVLKTHSPDMIFLGHDQQEIVRELDKLKMKYEFIEAHKPDMYKTSLIKNSP